MLGEGSVVAAEPLEVWLVMKWLLEMVFVGVVSPLEILQRDFDRALCAAWLWMMQFPAPSEVVWLQWVNFDLKTYVGLIVGLFGF